MDSSFVNTQCLQTLRLQLSIQRRQFKKFLTKILCKIPKWTNEYNIDFKIFLLILQFKRIFPISKMIALTFFSIPILSHARRSSADIQQIFEQWQEVRTIHTWEARSHGHHKLQCRSWGAGFSSVIFHYSESCLGLCESIKYNGRFKFAKAGKNGVGRRRY